jgi:hypothetical protein
VLNKPPDRPQQEPPVDAPPTPPPDADTAEGAIHPESARLTAEEKRARGAELLKAAPETSNRQIGDRVGVTHKVISKMRAEMEALGQIARLTTRIGRDGKKRTVGPARMPAAGAGDTKLNADPVESEWREPNSDGAAESQAVAGDGAVGPEATSAASKSVQAPKVKRREPEATAKESNAQQIQPVTAEDISNQQTIEQLALKILAATIGKKAKGVMSGLVLDDDDEESDEVWFDDHHKREKKFLAEAITDGLQKYPDINAINDLPLDSDPAIAGAAEQLKNRLLNFPIGATEFEARFSRAQLERIGQTRS